MADTPELPEPLKLENEKQQAACDAILASLSTGWWLGGRTLDPAKEAAAFTCFYHETVGDELNLYGFGGYINNNPYIVTQLRRTDKFINRICDRHRNFFLMHLIDQICNVMIICDKAGFNQDRGHCCMF